MILSGWMYCPVIFLTSKERREARYIRRKAKRKEKRDGVLKGYDTIEAVARLDHLDKAIDEGFVGTKAEWLASLKGETGAAGTNGTNGTDGVSPVANVTKTDDVIKIHIEDSTGTTEEEIDMSDYAKQIDVDYFYQTSDTEGEYDANDFAVVGKITRYCVKSPVHGYQVDGMNWWGFYETVCFRGNGYGYQTFRTMLGMPAMAIRQLYNGSWGNWQKLVTESDLDPGTSKTDIDANTVYYYRSGKVVTVVFNGFTVSSDVAQNARIGSLEFPHAVDTYGVYFPVADYNKNDAITVMRIDSRGHLLASFSASDQTKVVPGRYWGTVTYITG